MRSFRIIQKGCCLLGAASLLAGCSLTQKSDAVLRTGITQSLSGTFDPLYAVSTADQWVGDLVYQSLLDYDPDNSPVPVLAKGLPEISEDGMTIVFHLQADQIFSDGSVLDGDDVRFTFELLADPAYAGGYQDGKAGCIEGFDQYRAGSADTLSGIEVSPDHLSVTFHLSEPVIDADLAIGSVPILPDTQFEHVRGDLDAWQNMSWDELIGSGPYVVSEFDKDGSTKLSRNANYSGTQDYSIDSVIFQKIDPEDRLQMLQDQKIDLLPEQIDPSVIGPASQNADLESNYYPRAAIGCLTFRTQSALMKDPLVREALACAFDRESFVSSYYQWPEGKVSDDLVHIKPGYVPAAFWNPSAPGLGDIVSGDETMYGLETYDYNPTHAKALLDEAGWKPGKDGIREKNGKKLTVKFALTQDSTLLEKMVPELAKAWKEVGADLQKTTIDFNTLTASIDPTADESVGPWDCFFLGVGFESPSNTVMNAYESYSEQDGKDVFSSMNYARLKDPDLNKALDAGRKSSSPAQSIADYLDAMALASKQAAYIPVYANTQFDLYTKKLTGFETGPMCPWTRAIANASLES